MKKELKRIESKIDELLNVEIKGVITGGDIKFTPFRHRKVLSDKRPFFICTSVQIEDRHQEPRDPTACCPREERLQITAHFTSSGNTSKIMSGNLTSEILELLQCLDGRT